VELLATGVQVSQQFHKNYCSEAKVVSYIVHSFFNLAVGVNQTAILTELSVSLNLITYR
jgi:hypothetical protein